MKANTDKPDSPRHPLFSPALFFKPYGDIPGLLKNVCVRACVCVVPMFRKYHQFCATEEHTAAGVCEDACLQEAELEALFLHMLLTLNCVLYDL